MRTCDLWRIGDCCTQYLTCICYLKKIHFKNARKNESDLHLWLMEKNCFNQLRCCKFVYSCMLITCVYIYIHVYYFYTKRINSTVSTIVRWTCRPPPMNMMFFSFTSTLAKGPSIPQDLELCLLIYSELRTDKKKSSAIKSWLANLTNNLQSPEHSYAISCVYIYIHIER